MRNKYNEEAKKIINKIELHFCIYMDAVRLVATHNASLRYLHLKRFNFPDTLAEPSVIRLTFAHNSNLHVNKLYYKRSPHKGGLRTHFIRPGTRVE